MDNIYLMVIISIPISILLWIIIGSRWKNLSDFFHERYSFVELSFILIYFIEQVLLTIGIYLQYDPKVITGAFSIIVITTAALQNKCWESRTKKIAERNTRQGEITSVLQSKNSLIVINSSLSAGKGHFRK